MDSATYKALTGKTVRADQTVRFDMQKQVAQKKLERLLGYPLVPSTWGNQYIEIGKTDGCFDSSVDEDSLEPADDVIGDYRLFPWNPRDEYLLIDPATEIHAVKLVHRDVTVKTFDLDDIRPQWINDAADAIWTKSLAFVDQFLDNRNVCYWEENGTRLAVDATWAFTKIPVELLQVWADFIAYAMDDSRNVRSQSAGTHSYTKFSADDPLKVHAEAIENYAGPNRAGGDVGVA